MRYTAAPAPDRSAARPDPEITSGLVQACAQSLRVRVDYRTGTGREWTTEVDPWAIVVRHGRSLLTGTTDNPFWYAHQLTAIPTPYRILGGPELLAAARRIADRLRTAADGEPRRFVALPARGLRKCGCSMVKER